MSGLRKAVLVVALATAGTLWSCDRSSVASAPVVSSPPAATPNQQPPPPGAAVTPKTQTPDVAKSLSSAFANTAKAVRPSVVRIDIEGPKPPLAERRRRSPDDDDVPGDLPRFFRRFFFDFGEAPDFPQAPMPGPVRGTGSGIILDTAGNLVTNSHVVEHAAKVKVTLWDGQEIPAKVVGHDSRTDVAVVRLDRIPKNLVIARLGDSNRVQVGEWVLAIGSPLGLEQTVTAGIVSGKGHVGRLVQMSGDRVREYIQTDAKINPGNSGGPLVNLDGEVIGINTLIRTGAGGAYGFAVPINEVRRVAQALMKDGRIRYPYLGVMVRDLDTLDDDARKSLGRGAPEKGAYVDQVTPGSPAAKAGLKKGDVIVKLNGEAVKVSADVVDYVSARAIGAPVTVTVFRDGATKDLATKLGEAPSDEDASATAGPLGLSLQTLTPKLAESLGLPSETKGAAVAEVAPGSVAERAGLEPGDVILDVDRKPVRSADEAVDTLRSGRRGDHLLRVRGRNGVRFVTLGG
jgi:serine protease Do